MEQIYTPPCSGESIFLHFTNKFELLPEEEDSRKESSIKAGSRLIIALIALKFFLDLGFYYNLICGCIKGLLGILAYKNDKTFSDFNSYNFGQEVKRHFVFLVVDVAAVVFMKFFFVLYMLWPLELEQFSRRVQKIIYNDFPLGEIGELR